MTDEFAAEREAALNYANQARAELGLPPTDHLYPGDHVSESCAISATIKDDDWASIKSATKYVHTGRTSIRFGKSRRHQKQYAHPPLVSQFVHDFDKGRMPDLCTPDHKHNRNGSIEELGEPPA